MKLLKLFSLLFLSISFANKALAIKPYANEPHGSSKFDITYFLPDECTRNGEVTDELEIKCGKLRMELMQAYKNSPDFVISEQNEKIKKRNLVCEEVTDSYVICHHKRFILEQDAVSNTFNKVKEVTDILIKEVPNNKDVKK
jgi:hypothetical protein